MLMVVLGAGASYDSIDVKPPGRGNPGTSLIINEEFRSPLANDLFGPRKIFAETMRDLQRLQPIVPLLSQTGRKNIEVVLRELQDQADQYSERHCQLMAVRYYLHLVLWECGRQWNAAAYGVTNYKAVLDKIEQWRKPDETVCLVTFNYDTLLEDAMPVVGLTITDLSNYVSGSPDYKVFKLHGSVNWARLVETPAAYTPQANVWQVAQDLIERAPTLKITNEFVRVDQRPCEVLNGLGLVPAIAIPVERKASFECPQDHLSELEKLLPQVDKLLLIGWRAAEDHFLELLNTRLRHSLLGMVVAGSEGGARNIARSLEQGALSKVSVRWKLSPGGFTDFIVNQRADAILSRTPSAAGK